jgi:hypothetical protein
LKSKERKKPMGRTILIIVIVVVLIAATGVGAYAMGNNAGFQRANAVRQQFFQGRQPTGSESQPGGNFGGGAFGGGAGGAPGGNFAGRGIQGTVKSINGDTMVVTIGTRDVTVTLDSNTQFEKTASASKSDLATGARVTVTAAQPAAGAGGSNSADSITATSILIMPAQ